ncbi:F-box containing protein [Kurlavirus BKC-1]|nr:F-box containing protein [Kurlavirus BKC-1]
MDKYFGTKSCSNLAASRGKETTLQKNISSFSFTSKNMEFQDFPVEILLHVVGFLRIKDMNNFGQTCSLHYSIVRENDETLRRRRNLIKDTGEMCVHNVTPSGNGSIMLFSDGNVIVTSLKDGKRNGFEMEVLVDDTIRCGTYKDGKRIGIWKNDSARFREDWNGSSCRMKYGEDGLLYTQTKLDNEEVIIVPTENANIEIHYKELPLKEEFYCKNAKGTYCYWFGKYEYEHNTKEGTYKRVGDTGFFYCCKEHQGDMPDDILYFEEADGFLEVD